MSPERSADEGTARRAGREAELRQEPSREQPLERIRERSVECGWRVVAAAAAGAAHLRLDLPCQDALAYRVASLPPPAASPPAHPASLSESAEPSPPLAAGLPPAASGLLLAALADGAGSAPRSDLGARTAVDAALEHLSAELEAGLPADDDAWRGLLLAAVQTARERVVALAEIDGAAPRDYACTLICLAAAGDRMAAAALGDGILVVRDAGEDGAAGGLRRINTLQRGEYANETAFLTQDDALDAVELHIERGDYDAVALMSDGLSRLALRFPDQTPHAPFFDPLLAFAASSADAPAAPPPVQPTSPSESARLSSAVEGLTAQPTSPSESARLLSANVPSESARLASAVEIQPAPPALGASESSEQLPSAESSPPPAGARLAAFLASERVSARTDDDKALLLAVRC